MRQARIPPGRYSGLGSEALKLPAFVRKDFLVAWSYRAAFFSDILNLVAQITLFYFVSLMVDPSVIPSYGGQPTSYIAFVSVGIALGAFLALGLGRVATAMRNEQLMGTLEVLYMTPTAPLTLQLGLAVYDLVYVPIRTFVFLAAVFLVYDVSVAVGGIAPAALILALFIPFVWGIGMISAAGVMTFRRGAGILGLGALALNITSGAYFPLTLFPEWVQTLAKINPLAAAYEGTRSALLGGAAWSELTSEMLILGAAAILSLSLGSAALGVALRRERAKGTLGRY
ncbi:MAG TPA: ABC transporter permease [Acidimicrobiia bacterium]